ncbi:hypothetical protein CSA80_01795 [Candidatus Saccharibacteria bacterium]|nr:MAG: hypothetical protein CSA80_01795 [Candidatus Saccharibacteria bacterium]
MILHALVFVVALALVVKCADWFLGAAERIGVHWRLPGFVLGVLLVGIGTSLPELATSIASVLAGENQIVLSNVLGSNIANVLIIIGVSTFILGTIRFKKDIIDLDLPLLLTVSAMFVVLLVDGVLQRSEAVLLILGLLGYLLYTLMYNDEPEQHKGFISLLRGSEAVSSVVSEKPKPKRQSDHDRAEPQFSAKVYVVALLSVVGLAAASKYAVDSLLWMVESAGIAVGVVSFFALAVGTSLPELVVSLKALGKGKGDIVMGNIVGSCMFNMLLIAGLGGVLAPQVLAFPEGVWMLTGLTVTTLLFVVVGITKRVQLWEGMMFLLLYAALGIQILS